MGRWALLSNIQGTPKYCLDKVSGNYYPPKPCPPKGQARVIKRGEQPSQARNFLGGMITKENMVPTVIGAGAGAFVGHLASKKIKIGMLGKWNKPVLMIAGGILGVVVGKMVAAKMESMNVEHITIDDTTPATDVTLNIE